MQYQAAIAASAANSAADAAVNAAGTGASTSSAAAAAAAAAAAVVDESIIDAMARMRSELVTRLPETTATIISTSTFECRDCGKHYRHSNNLHRHRRFECGKEPQFMCPYCQYKAKLKDNLKKHVVYKHKGKL